MLLQRSILGKFEAIWLVTSLGFLLLRNWSFISTSSIQFSKLIRGYLLGGIPNFL
jgi:hypothetical protein